MLRFDKHRLTGLLIAGLSVVLALGLLLGACGDEQEPSDPAVSSTTATQAGTASSTVPATSSTTTAQVTLPSTTEISVPADSTTTTAATTTTDTTVSATVTSVVATTTTKPPTTTSAKPTTTTAAPTTTTAAPTTTTAKAPTALKVSGPSGMKELSMADLKALPATSGYGGWKNQLSNITAPASWKGVSLPVLMELVGGGGSVTVVASDGYTMPLSAGEARGSVNTYDPATGDPVGGISVKAIIAYAKGGGALGSGEGPLRIAFVSSDANQVTDSDMWVKYVVELRFN